MKGDFNNKFSLLLILFLPLTICNCDNRNNYDEGNSNIENQYDDIQDGIYDATVTTPSGTYDVQISVSNGEVEYVDWPNGGHMSLDGATVTNKHAVGTNSNGDEIEIDIH